MVLKTHFKTNHGFTIVELLVVIAVIGILLATLILVFNPLEQIKKGRDNKRLSDISLLDRAITEYFVDYGVYPDTADTLRTSTVLPTGSTALAKATSGWIKHNISGYTSRLPIDPLNDDDYFYSYYHNSETYELNANLEILTTEPLVDGGSSDTIYEVGNNLNLITP